LSPDGKWAVSVSTTQPTQLTLLHVGPGQPHSINVTGLPHIQNGWARFLPNGKSVIVNGDEAAGGAARCYLVDISTGAARPVTPEGFVCGPSSSDSRFVIGKGQTGSAVTYSIDGGPSRAIPNLYPTFNPLQWSNDGSRLYGSHIGEVPGKIYQVQIATGKETVVQELNPGVPAGVVMVGPIVVSRDGARFLYSYNQTLSVLYLISGLR
jgi:Tol biopolymer transport system component